MLPPKTGVFGDAGLPPDWVVKTPGGETAAVDNDDRYPHDR